MRVTKLADDTTNVVVLESGDDAVESLRRFLREANVAAGHMTAIGGFSRAVLGYFDWETKGSDVA